MRDQQSRAATNRNILAAGAVPGAIFATVAGPTQTGTLKVGSPTIASAADAASALASMRKNAQERFFVLVTDAKRRPIAVIKLFAGSTKATGVYPEVVTKAVYELPEAAHVWYAHNHPGGSPVPSMADMMITRSLSQAFGDGTGVTVDGHVIIAGTQAAELNADGMQIGEPIDIKPVARTISVPILERRFTKVGSLWGALNNPAASRAAIPRITGGQTGVVFMSAQMRPSAFLPMSIEQMKKLRDDGAPSGARILFGAAARSNAAAAMLNFGDKVLTQREREALADAVTNLSHALGKRGVSVLDAFYQDADGLQSWQEHGNQQVKRVVDGTFFSVGAGARTRETPQSIRAAIVARFGEPAIKALEDGGVLKIVGSADEVPPGLLRESNADAIYDPRNKIAYLIADRLTRDLAPAKVLHEIGEHYGLETMLGERGWRALTAKVRVLARVEGSRAQAVWSAIKESYSEFASLSDADLAVNERFLHEVIAHLGETQAFRQTSVWRDLVALLKRFLVKLGFADHITEEDVGALLEGSLRHAARGDGRSPPPGGGVSTEVSTGQLASLEQTSSPAFRRWFDESEVVDAEGKPLVVYHGTDVAKDFTDFAPGSFFTTSAEEASAYAKPRDFAIRQRAIGKYAVANGAAELDGREVPYYGVIGDATNVNPGDVIATDNGVFRALGGGKWQVFSDLVVDYSFAGERARIVRGDAAVDAASIVKEYDDYIRENFPGGDGGRVTPAFLSLKNPVKLPAFKANLLGKRLGATDDSVSAAIEKYRALGYDGIVTESDEATMFPGMADSLGGVPRHFIIFDPTQAKSAIGNTGEFNPENPDILRSIAQTTTPAFKRWFGDWQGDAKDASKVVDAEGRPRAMYHSTTAGGFSKFKRGDIGIHFGTKGQAEDRFEVKRAADPYGPELRGVSHTTMPVYLNIRNPLRMRDLGEWHSIDLINGLPEAGIDPGLLKRAFLARSEAARLKVIREVLESLGYDGIVYKNKYEIAGIKALREARDEAREEFEESKKANNGNAGIAETSALENAELAYEEHKKDNAEDSYIAFHPEQIKSAVGNAGTFDPKSKDILLSAPAPTFYSELARQVDRAPMKRAPAGAWMQYINALKTKGVKPDEIAWSGVEEFLEAQPGKVSKEQVAEFLRGNGVRVEEVMLGGETQQRIPVDEFSIETDEGVRIIARLATDDDGELFWEFDNGEQSEVSFNSALDAREWAEISYGAQLRNGEFSWTQDTRPEDTRFSQEQLPGGEDYRELLLTLPPNQQNAPETRAAEFRSTHFDQPNILAHVRFNERTHVSYSEQERAEADRRAQIGAQIRALDAKIKRAQKDRHADESAKLDLIREEVRAEVAAGRMPERGIARAVEDRFSELPKTDLDARVGELLSQRRALQESMPPAPAGTSKRVLFIEEIQSDWGQKGRREGFSSGESREVERDRRIAEAEARGATPAELRAIEQADSVPSAPFVTKTEAWAALALKRMIRYASENGFDEIAWTTGEQQVDRYREALRKAVDRIEWTKQEGGIRLVGHKDGRQVVDTTEKQNAISDAIGKSMGEAIINDPNQSGVIEGDDITISDTGMTGFYERIVPNVANDILKKFGGGRVTTIDLEIGAQPAFTITPELRASAMQGMPLFSLGSTNRLLMPDRVEAEAFRAELRRQLGSLKSNVPPMNIGKTTPALLLVGAQQLPVTISRDVVRKATNDVKHNVTMEAIERLPEELANPVMVFESATERGSFVVLTSYQDKSGRPVVVAIHFGQTAPATGSYQINRIASVYGKEQAGWVAQQIKHGLLRYRSKATSLAWLDDNGLQLPNSLPVARGSWSSVRTEDDLVNDAPMASIPLNPRGTVGVVALINAHYNLYEAYKGSGPVLIRPDGSILIDGIIARVGDVLYADKDGRFVRELPQSEIDAIARSKSSRIARLTEISKRINRSVARTSPAPKPSEDDIFGLKTSKYENAWQKARYEGLTRHMLEDFRYVDSISDRHDPEAIRDAVVREVLDNRQFKIGGLLHTIEDNTELTPRLRAAILAYQNAGGRLGRSALDALGGNDGPMASVPLNLHESLRSAPVRQSIRDRIADFFGTQKTFNWWHKSLGTQYHKAKVDKHFRRVFEGAQQYLDDVSRFANEAADNAPGLLPKTEGLADAFVNAANTVTDARDAQALAGPLFQGTLRDRVFTDAELLNPPLELGKPLFKPLTERQAKLYRQFLGTVNHSLDTLAM